MTTTWGCPHEDEGRCRRRRKVCEPLARGCVLEGQGVKMIQPVPCGTAQPRGRRRSPAAPAGGRPTAARRKKESEK